MTAALRYRVLNSAEDGKTTIILVHFFLSRLLNKKFQKWIWVDLPGVAFVAVEARHAVHSVTEAVVVVAEVGQ